MKNILEKNNFKHLNGSMNLNSILNFMDINNIKYNLFNNNNYCGNTINDFCQLNLKGFYFVLSPTHISVVRDGELEDFPRAGNYPIKSIYSINL